MIEKAKFETTNYQVNIEEEIPVINSQTISKVETFQKSTLITLETDEQTTATISNSEINSIIAQRNVFNLVLETPDVVFVSESNEIKLFIADENILKNQPVIINDDDTVAIASSLNENHFNRFLGICTADCLEGQLARIKISGTILDEDKTYNLDKEIFLGDGELIQDFSGNELFSQQIANVLTKHLIVISRNEPIKLQ